MPAKVSTLLPVKHAVAPNKTGGFSVVHPDTKREVYRSTDLGEALAMIAKLDAQAAARGE